MEYQEIEIIIAPNGEVTIQVHGVKGMACLDLTRALEEALGNEILARDMLPAAYATDESLPNQTWLKTS